MSRRSGLGRGLAALIPPSVPDEQREEEDELAGDGTAPIGNTGPSTPAVEPSTDPQDHVTAPDPEDPGDGVPSPPDAAVGAGPEPVATDGAIGPSHPTVQPDDHEEVREVAEWVPETGSESVDLVRPAVVTAPVPAPGLSPEAADDARVPPAAATLAEVAPGSIVPNPRQPREVFDPDELAHLATSLADVGILQPLVVRPLEDGGYELVAGERRLRAAMLAGLSTVPVVIRHTDDADLLKEALVENIHRVQLNPLEEGAAYQQLLEEFGVTQEELAARLGRSRPAISNAIRLLQLPPGVQRRVASGVLSAGHAKVLLAIDDPAQQLRLADRIVAEGISVRATEELVRLRLLDETGGSSGSRRKPVAAPGLVELQDDLSDALEARVRISMGAKRGKLAIEFASVDDLERIVSVIANGLEGTREVVPVPPATGDGPTAPDHG